MRADPRLIYIEIDESEWDRCGDRPDELLYYMGPALIINGVFHHLEAWPVEKDEDGLQVSVHRPEDFESLASVFSMDGSWETVEIDGQECCLFISPYS